MRSHVLVPTAPTKPAMLKRLQALSAGVPEAAELVLLGDSLAAGWPASALPPGCRVFNFGLPGERIQNTLWRLQPDITGHLRPRHVVLQLGTNNLGDGDEADAIEAGLAAVLDAIDVLWGDPQVLLLTIPRRGAPPGFRDAERRGLNQGLARRYAAASRITVIDSDAALSEGGDGLGPSLDPDLLHLSAAGYRRLGRALAPHLTCEDALSAPRLAAPAGYR